MYREVKEVKFLYCSLSICATTQTLLYLIVLYAKTVVINFYLNIFIFSFKKGWLCSTSQNINLYLPASVHQCVNIKLRPYIRLIVWISFVRQNHCRSGWILKTSIQSSVILFGLKTHGLAAAPSGFPVISKILISYHIKIFTKL